MLLIKITLRGHSKISLNKSSARGKSRDFKLQKKSEPGKGNCVFNERELVAVGSCSFQFFLNLLTNPLMTNDQ